MSTLEFIIRAPSFIFSYQPHEKVTSVQHGLTRSSQFEPCITTTQAAAMSHVRHGISGYSLCICSRPCACWREPPAHRPGSHYRRVQENPRLCVPAQAPRSYGSLLLMGTNLINSQLPLSLTFSSHT